VSRTSPSALIGHNVCICMCVCMFVCRCVNLFVCMHVCVYAYVTKRLTQSMTSTYGARAHLCVAHASPCPQNPPPCTPHACVQRQGLHPGEGAPPGDHLLRRCVQARLAGVQGMSGV
jgi:hypothetical protein